MGLIETISIIIAIVGCFVGLAGWLTGRDKRVIDDAEWRGQINVKLDMVVNQGIATDKTVDGLDSKLDLMNERLVTVEASAKQAHRRLDTLEGKKGN